MRRRVLVSSALSVAALGLTACGGDSDSSEEAEEAAATPQQAVVEIGEVRAGLDEALAAYGKGDAKEAQTLAEDAYLEHFELVEGPLEEVDAELNEELEDAIREELPDKIASSASVAKVEGLIEEIGGELDEAERALSAEA